MRQELLILVCLMAIGCAYTDGKIDGYLDDPKTLLTDPLTVDHKQDLSDLESRYLRQELTYADYLDQKKQLEENYIKDVRKREGVLTDQ